jgi:vesicle coat complex subunit
MDWPTTNPIPTTGIPDAITSLSEQASGLVNSTMLTLPATLSNISNPYGDAHFFEESISPSTVRTQLVVTGDPSNASTTLNLLKGMKWLLANMSKGRNVSDFFSAVVKLVGVPNLEVRKMVYIYLARYANHDAECRELALLSINAFQRGLSDREPLCRSLALRVLTVLDVPDVLQLQILGVQTCIKDGSPYVRKCAVGAIGKLHPRCVGAGDLSQAENLVNVLTRVLEEEASTMVLTSAIITFTEICPQRLELLHGCYRKICHLLTDMDEWGQVVVIDTLMRYCRVFFKQPIGQKGGSAEKIDVERRVTRSTRKHVPNRGKGNMKGDTSVENTTNDSLPAMGLDSKPAQPATNGIASSTKKVKRRVVRKAFYSDEEDESSEEELPVNYPVGGNIAQTLRDTSVGAGFRDDAAAVTTTNGGALLGEGFDDDEDGDLSEDHKLLLSSSLPLLKSRNSAVVLAVCSLHYYCGIASVKIRTALGKALVRIHRDRREIQYIVLVSIRTLVLECPSAFTPFLNDFFVKGMDPSFTRMIKLDILVSLCMDPTSIEAALSELRTYVRHSDKAFVGASIRAVGKVSELARIVYDRRASTGDIDSSRARSDANLIALDCLSGLVSLSEFSRNEVVVGECAETMQRILAQLWSNDGNIVSVNDPTKIQERVLKRLFLILSRALMVKSVEEEEQSGKHKQLVSRAARVPDSAVASIVWVVGEWSTMNETLTGPWALEKPQKTMIRLEILRLLAKSFNEIDSQTKLQAVHLSSKILLLLKSDPSMSDQRNKEEAICEFILSMGRVDVIQDVRDRSRYESNILQSSIGFAHDTAGLSPCNASNLMTLEKAKTMLLKQKPTASSLSLTAQELGNSDNEDLFRFGTLSSIIGCKSGGSGRPLPKWAEADSPSSLRDQSVLLHESEPTRRDGIAGTSSNLYSSSSSDDESSDDSSSCDSESGSDSSASSDESDSDSDSSDGKPAVISMFGSNGVNNQVSVAPSLQQHAPVTSLLNNGSDESSSDNDSSSESSDDSSDEDTSKGDTNGIANTPAVGTILDMSPAANQPQIPTQYACQNSNVSSIVAAGLEDLVMTPLVVDKNDVSKSTKSNGESSTWKEYVRPELGGGLLVKMRFLRGTSRANECKIMGLDPENASTVCLQVHIENK